MKVIIKQFDVGMEIKNNGIEFDVSEPSGKHLGDLVLTKTKLIWCEGRKSRENGKEISWAKFMEFMNQDTEN